MSPKLGLRQDFGLHYMLKLRDGKKAPRHVSLNRGISEGLVTLVNYPLQFRHLLDMIYRVELYALFTARPSFLGITTHRVSSPLL